MKNKTANTQDRTSVTPVNGYTEARRGIKIAAGTFGTLSYVGGSRGWCFWGANFSVDVKASDLFKFVKAYNVAEATTGTDLTEAESEKVAGVERNARRLRSLRSFRAAETKRLAGYEVRLAGSAADAGKVEHYSALIAALLKRTASLDAEIAALVEAAK